MSLGRPRACGSRRDRARVCLITREYPPQLGGVGRAVERVALGLASRGFAVHVVCPGEGRPDPSFVTTTDGPVTVHRTTVALGGSRSGTCGANELWQVGAQILALHQNSPFDVVHGVCVLPAGLVAAHVSAEAELPFVLSSHGGDVELARYSVSELASVCWVLERADFVTAVSDDLLAKIRRLVALHRACVVPNCFDASLYDECSLAEISDTPFSSAAVSTEAVLRARTEGQLIVGTLAKFRPVKDLSLLIDVIARLRRRGRQVVLLAVGGFASEEDARNARERIDTLGLRDRVILTGAVPRSQVLAWLRQMDIFALPSQREGHPNVLLEAMATARPIVATRVGGVPEIVEHDREGLLVAPGRTDELERALDTLLMNPVLRQRLAEAGRAAVERRHSVASERAAWLGVYRQLLGRAVSARFA